MNLHLFSTVYSSAFDENRYFLTVQSSNISQTTTSHCGKLTMSYDADNFSVNTTYVVRVKMSDGTNRLYFCAVPHLSNVIYKWSKSK